MREDRPFMGWENSYNRLGHFGSAKGEGHAKRIGKSKAGVWETNNSKWMQICSFSWNFLEVKVQAFAV